MKKIFTIALLFCTVNIAFTQNTFPATGNVGIGTTSPTQLLQVIGTIEARNAIFPSGNSVSINGGNTATAGSVNVNRLRYGGSDANSLYFTIQGANNIDYFTINSCKIGIGTTSPSKSLEVNGTILSNKVWIGIGINSTNSAGYLMDVHGNAIFEKL